MAVAQLTERVFLHQRTWVQIQSLVNFIKQIYSKLVTENSKITEKRLHVAHLKYLPLDSNVNKKYCSKKFTKELVKSFSCTQLINSK